MKGSFTATILIFGLLAAARMTRLYHCMNLRMIIVGISKATKLIMLDDGLKDSLSMIFSVGNDELLLVEVTTNFLFECTGDSCKYTT